MRRNNRRKIVLINRNFQYRMIAKFILLNIIIMFIFGCFLYIFLNSEIESNLHSAHVSYKNIKEMLFPIVVTLSIINILVSSMIIGVFVLFASFRIAGPLYRFNEVVKAMCNKDLKPATTIREGDQLYECSITLKNMSDVIATDLYEIKDKISQIKDFNKKDSATESKLYKKIEELEGIMNQYRF